MKRASGVAHLRPFLPGLETLLEDAEVSEIMINGPGNVWVERAGRLESHEAPALTAQWLHRAAIHIARPLGLDPAARPILDARLDDGSRVAICTPPASPEVAITIRRFGGRAFSAEDLVRMGSLPEEVLRAARETLAARRNILVSGGTGSGKTTLLNALIELLPLGERIVAIEDTLELRIDRANCVRFEAGSTLSETPVEIRDLVRHALRHRPDHIVVGEVRGGEGRRPAPGARHRPRRFAHDHAREQRALRALAARKLRHAGRRGAPLGGHLPGRRGRNLPRRSRDPPGGQAVRRGGHSSRVLRRPHRALDHRTGMDRAHEAPGEPNTQPRNGGERMMTDERTIRITTLDDFDRELARDGGEALQVPARLAEEYGLFPEDVGTEYEIRDAVMDPRAEEEDR